MKWPATWHAGAPAGAGQEQAQQQEQLQQPEPPELGVWAPGLFLQVLDELLQLVERVMELLLHHDVGGSSSSSSSREAADSQAQVQAQVQISLKAVVDYLVCLSRVDIRDLCGESVEGGTCQSQAPQDLVCLTPPELPPQAEVWFDHAPQLCAVLEARLRQALGSTTATEAASQILPLLGPLSNHLSGVLLQAAAAAGPCSKHQVQLYSLLKSMLKWAAVLDSTQGQQLLAEELRATVAGSSQRACTVVTNCV